MSPVRRTAWGCSAAILCASHLRTRGLVPVVRAGLVKRRSPYATRRRGAAGENCLKTRVGPVSGDEAGAGASDGTQRKRLTEEDGPFDGAVARHPQGQGSIANW